GATAAANTTSSQNSDLIPGFSSRASHPAHLIRRISSRLPLPPRLVAAYRLEALGDARQLEADRGGGELLQLVQRVGGLLGARIEVALDPALRRAQILAVSGLVAREERKPRAEQAQLQVLAHEV